MHNPVQLFHLKPRSINIQYGFFLNTFNSDGNKTQDNTCRHLKKKPKKVFSYSIMPFTQIFEEKNKKPTQPFCYHLLPIYLSYDRNKDK